LFLGHFFSYSQQLDNALKSGSADIAQKAIKKNKHHVAIADFTTNTGKSNALTAYVTQQVETYLINAEGDIGIIDRKKSKELLMAENRWQSLGLIDESAAKSSVNIIKVDGWVLGEVSVFGDQIKITIKIVDITTSVIYGAYTSELITDPAIKQLLDPTNKEDSHSRNKDCLTANTGDYCFTNATDKKIFVKLESASGSYPMTLEVGQTQCVYDLTYFKDRENVVWYQCRIWKEIEHFAKQNLKLEQYPDYIMNPYAHSEIKIERCKSRTFVVK
jgi:hypothetical protein